MGRYGPIEHFTDIEAHKISRKLKILIYKIAKSLPPEEKYNLASQLRRAAVSITSNIAEGYGRYHYQENIQFCRQSRGSMCELQDHLISCLDLEYITKEKFKETYGLVEQAIKSLNGYIRLLEKHKLATSE